MGRMQLDRPVQFLKGVGPKRADALKKLRIGTAHDLLFHLPRRYDDASTILPVGTLKVGMDATARGFVRSKGILGTRAGLRVFQVVLQDDSGYITCSWPGQPWLDRKIHEGDELLVTGPVKHFHGRQLHPRELTLLSRARDREGGEEEGRGEIEEEAPMASGQPGRAKGTSQGGAIEPTGAVYVSYPTTDEVPQWVLRDILSRNLDWMIEQAPEEEYLSERVRKEIGLVGLAEAFTLLHRPNSAIEPERGRRRLAFDEFFFLQLVQAIARHRETEVEKGIAFERTNRLIRPLHEALPFELTGAQARVLREIYQDMTSPRRMNRFLQGDVGSGKTLVALFAMLLAAESGFQSAMMAPTELLAEQHAFKIRELIAKSELDLEVAFVTGRLTAKERRAALSALGEGGKATIGIGTHALIQDGVTFRRLGLVIVDEQHRFGVRQRMALSGGATALGGRRDNKVGTGTGAPTLSAPDVLVMSATPIPRSLALALYGDLDLSILDEVPAGRTPIETRLHFPNERDRVYARVEEELAKGHQGYIVYPLVEESDKIELRAASQERERLAREVFPHRRVGLLHGQLAPEEKDAVMQAFRRGELDLLVATTIVEVGIDVPNATVMVIEHAERFGLSQLHQLRGRVGRGSAPSLCILVAEGGEATLERLKVFRDTLDGFKIARADLMIRGQGDLFGAQQHGKDPLLRFADLGRDEDLLDAARELARGIIASDPGLDAPEHERIRELLAWRHGERLKMWKVG